MSPYQELLECGVGPIADMAMKCEAVFATHERAHVGISGGADSDVMLDLCERVRQVQPIEIHYEWNNTGIEWSATKEHLGYLEERYGVTIRRVRPDVTVPVCARRYGQPFLSKMVSHHMHILQTHGFQWDDEPLALLRKSYPDAPVSTLRWWSNDYLSRTGAYTSYCIGRNKWLREFVIENPPWFPISGKCCTYAKKNPADRSAVELGCDVRLIGTRKSEGGGTLTCQPLLRVQGRWAGHVQAAVLAVGRGQGGVRQDVRHHAQRLLRMGVQAHWLCRLPVQPRSVRGPGACDAA